MKKVAQKKILFKDILTAPSKEGVASTSSVNASSLYTSKFLPAEYKDAPVDILVWDDHVAIIALTEPVFGTVLTHKNIAETLKMVVSILWRSL